MVRRKDPVHLYYNFILVLGLLRSEVEKYKEPNGFIFDGFPRTSYQAEKLDALLTKYSLNIHLTIALDVDNETLIKRLLNRGKSSGRADDQSEDKINKRLQEYDKKTKPLIEFYTKQNKYKSINGIGEMDNITARIVNLLDNYLGLILVHSCINLPLAVLLMKSFYDDIPKEIDENAFIDGASKFIILHKLILPLSLGGLSVTFILSFIFSWTEFICAASAFPELIV